MSACPQCHTSLRSATSRFCHVCGATITPTSSTPTTQGTQPSTAPQVTPHPPVSMPVIPASKYSTKAVVALGILIILVTVGFAVNRRLKRKPEAMSGPMGGIYSDGQTTITFRGNHFWFHGGYDADADFDLQGNTLRLLPSPNWQQKMTPEERNFPLAWHTLGRDTFTATASDDKSTFIMNGAVYRRQ